MTKNPLTFKDIDPSQFDNCASDAPFSPLFLARFGPCSSTDASEPHNIGEVWCVTLWEARRNLINYWGYSVGNPTMLELVTDGMMLCPPNPNFIQARDAIIQAVAVNSNCFENWGLVWAAFSNRGMGPSASAPASNLASPVGQSFDPAPPAACL